MIAEGKRDSRINEGNKMRQNNKRSAAAPSSLHRAPLLESFNAWLYSARHAQMLFENRCDLAALQLAHEDGAVSDEDLRIKASLILETEIHDRLRASRKRISGTELLDGDVAMWYVVPYSLGQGESGGRLLVSRISRVATLFFCPKRSEEKVTKYTLAFVSEHCTDEFMFGLLRRTRDLSTLTPSTKLKGSQGLLALTATQTPADRNKADAVLRRVVPKQLKTILHAAEKIRRWWLRILRDRRAIAVPPILSACSSPIMRADGASTPFSSLSTQTTATPSTPLKPRIKTTPVRRRTKSMRMKQKQVSMQKKRKQAAETIQRAFRTHLDRKRHLVSSCITIQRAVRGYLRRISAVRVLHRFFRSVLETTRRRHAITRNIIETREALYARVSADMIDFYNATHATMVHFYPLYNMIIDQVRESALRVNPCATVEPFGSSVTGLALPSSDLDLVICFQPPTSPIPLSSTAQLGSHSMNAFVGAKPFVPQFPPAMMQQHRGRYDHPRPGAGPDYDWNAHAEEVAHFYCRKLLLEKDWVRSARVVGSDCQPVIKLLCHPRTVPQFCIHVDLTLWHPKHTGIQNSLLIRDFVLPNYYQVAPMVLVIKQYLRECKLNSVYSGGLSSISLAVMVWIYTRNHFDPSVSLGELLLGFFETFGEEGFFGRYGVSAKEGIFCLAHLEERQHDFQPPATIEDPLREGNNLAAGMFRVGEVTACFRHALRTLAESTDIHPLNDLLRCRPVPVMQDMYPPHQMHLPHQATVAYTGARKHVIAENGQ